MEENLKELGWAVVPDVSTKEECNRFISEYREWLSKFGKEVPVSFGSIIDEYNLGHKKYNLGNKTEDKACVFKDMGNQQVIIQYGCGVHWVTS